MNTIASVSPVVVAPGDVEARFSDASQLAKSMPVIKLAYEKRRWGVERFELNREHLKELGEEVARAVEEAANEVAQTHSGKPESEVRSALEAALANRGYLHSEPPDDIVRQIAGGDPRKFKS